MMDLVDSVARHLGMFNDKINLGADRSLLQLLEMIDGRTRGLPSGWPVRELALA